MLGTRELYALQGAKDAFAEWELAFSCALHATTVIINGKIDENHSRVASLRKLGELQDQQSGFDLAPFYAKRTVIETGRIVHEHPEGINYDEAWRVCIN